MFSLYINLFLWHADFRAKLKRKQQKLQELLLVETEREDWGSAMKLSANSTSPSSANLAFASQTLHQQQGKLKRPPGIPAPGHLSA